MINLKRILQGARNTSIVFCLIVFTTCLGACTSLQPARGAVESPETEAPSQPYVSRVGDPKAKALFYFSQAQLLAGGGQFSEAVASLSKAIELDPDSAYLHLQQGEFYLHLNDAEKAIRALEDTLILEPDSKKALMLLGNIYFQQKNDTKAAEYYRKVLELDPEQDAAALQLGIALARSGDTEEAVDTLKALRKRRPDSIMADLTLARLYREIGLDALSEESYRNVIKQRPDLEQAYLELGALYEKQDDFPKAIATFREALKIAPENLSVRHHLALIFINRGELPQALAELQAALKYNPQDLDALRKIGLIYMEQEKWADAADTFRQILDVDPNLDQVAFYLGTSLERQQLWQEAAKTFESIPKTSPLYSDVASHLAFLYAKLDRTDDAIHLVEGQIGQSGGSPEMYSFLASLYESHKNYPQALDVLNKGLQRFPKADALAYQKGLVLEREGDRQGAIAAMRQAIGININQAEAMNFIAYSFAETKENLDEALSLALRALELKNEGHIQDTVGWVYYQMGHFKEARKYLEEAAKQLPEDALISEHLGDAYRALKLVNKARKAYEKAIELDSPQADEVQKKLKELKGEH